MARHEADDNRQGVCRIQEHGVGISCRLAHPVHLLLLLCIDQEAVYGGEHHQTMGTTYREADKGVDQAFAEVEGVGRKREPVATDESERGVEA